MYSYYLMIFEEKKRKKALLLCTCRFQNIVGLVLTKSLWCLRERDRSLAVSLNPYVAKADKIYCT